MRVLKQSTVRSVTVLMISSTDHITGLAGLTLTITASKDGGAFASITPTVTDLGSGWYKLALTTAHTDTLGDLAVHITSAGADPQDLLCQVVAYDMADAAALGLSRLDAAISSRMATFSLPANFAAMSITAGGLVDITQAAADKVWSTVTRVLTAGTNIVLAKGTGITGFNDPSTASISSAVWQDATAGDFTVAGSIGKSLFTSGNAPGTASGLALVGSNVGTATSVSGAVGSVTGNVGGNVVGSVASVTARVTANTDQLNGQAVLLDPNNLLKVDVEDWKGAAVSALVQGLLPSITSIRSGTAQAGASSSITLDAGASATTDFYKGIWVYIVSGTGAGQVRLVNAYNGTSKVASVNRAFATAPDVTSVFVLMAAADIESLDTAPADSSGVTTLLARLTAGRATNLDNVDATVSSRLPTANISLSAGAVTVGTNNDKTNYSLSAAGVQAIWDALTSALTTVNSIGKRLVDNIDAAVSSRSSHTANDGADALLGRNIAGGSSAGRLVKDAFRFIRNRKAISGGTLTVYQEDDSTSAWTASVTTTAGNPISEVDPT